MKILDFFFKKKKPNFKSAYIIINPTAGKMKIDRFINQSKNYFNKRKIKYKYSLTKSPGNGTNLAKSAIKEKYDIVFAAGGDGTINEVLNGIINSPKTVLGIIPLGTINIMALEFNIPLNPIRALSLIEGGEVKKIDIGKVNDKYFASLTGCGFDSYAIYRVNLKLKKYLGALAYIISGILSAFKYKPKKIIIDIDNNRINEIGYYVVVENAGDYGGRYKIVPYADYNDGLLDVCVFKKGGYLDIFRYFLGIALGKHLKYPDVRYYQCRNIKLHSDENVLLHVDGDIVGSLPATISVKKERLNLLCPKKIKNPLEVLQGMIK